MSRLTRRAMLAPKGAAPDNTPDPISIAPISETFPGTYAEVNRSFTVTGINVGITLSLERSGQTQTGSPNANRIDIYTKPSGGSFSLAAQLGPVPGAVKSFPVANGTEVVMAWTFESSGGAASTSFGLILKNVTTGATLNTTSYQMTLTG